MTAAYATHLDAGGRPRCGHKYAWYMTADEARVTCGACLRRLAGGNTLGIRHPDWQLRPHGTPGAYRRHYRRKEKVCETCQQWKTRDNQDRRARKTAA